MNMLAEALVIPVGWTACGPVLRGCARRACGRSTRRESPSYVPSATCIPDTENLRQGHQPGRAGPALACAVVISPCAGGGVLAGRSGPGQLMVVLELTVMNVALASA